MIPVVRVWTADQRAPVVTVDDLHNYALSGVAK
jgi:hypothetical protein